jgi:hypothetical protein
MLIRNTKGERTTKRGNARLQRYAQHCGQAKSAKQSRNQKESDEEFKPQRSQRTHRKDLRGLSFFLCDFDS